MPEVEFKYKSEFKDIDFETQFHKNDEFLRVEYLLFPFLQSFILNSCCPETPPEPVTLSLCLRGSF